MRLPKATLSEIKARLRDPHITVAQLATSLGLTRQALYERLRAAGIDVRNRKRANTFAPKHSRAVLKDVYEGKRLTLSAIADRLGTSKYRITSELEGYGIKLRTPPDWKRIHPRISEMAIGDSFDLPLPEGKRKTFSHLYHRRGGPVSVW